MTKARNIANATITIGSTTLALGGTITTFPGVTSVNGTTIPASSTLLTSLTGQALNTNLTGVSGLLVSGTGLIKNTAGTWSYDTNAYITGSSPTITTPIIDTINTSLTTTGTASLWNTGITTGTISIGGALTTGTINIATGGTSVTNINLGHTNALIGLTGNTTITGTVAATGLAGSLLSATVGTSLGTASAGTSTTPARSDHVHPTTGLVTTFSAGTTGLTPATATSGAITLAGTLAVANGGTGATTSTGTAASAVVLQTSPTITTPTIDVINAASATGTTATLFTNISTGSINIGGSALTTGTINIGVAGTGINPIVIGKSTSTITLGALPTAGFVKTSATGLLSVDTNTYLTTTAAGTTYSPIAGSASITTVGTVTAGSFPAANLSGTTLASGVTASSLTSVGTISTGTWSGLFGAVSGANLTSLTAANIAAGTLGSTVLPAAGTVTTAGQIGYMGLPQNLNPGAYTITAADNGKHLYYTTTGQTVTIPAAATLALPIGFTFVVINAAAVTTSIAITTDTMYLAGTGATGTRTLAAYGMATVVKVAGPTSAGVWMISGNGLT